MNPDKVNNFFKRIQKFGKIKREETPLKERPLSIAKQRPVKNVNKLGTLGGYQVKFKQPVKATQPQISFYEHQT